jgi:hypothetical protein
MKGSEKHLLVAVRKTIRSECEYTDQQCEIELDELAPATVGQLYVPVVPGGCRPGRVQNTSGGVRDLIWSVNVLVIKRIRNVPRDRLRSVFFENISCLDDEIDKIVEAVDWNYDVIEAATAALAAEGETMGFVEPLRFVGLDDRPRLANPELFAGASQNAGNVACGMVRTIRFSGARRITHTRNQA